MIKDPLHVIAVISNPVRYQSRYRLYTDFKKHILESNKVILHTVEVAFGDRPFAITDENNRNDIQLRTEHELWHKENMINIGISRLPENWKYVAWIDADIRFCRPDWAEETLHQLQHHRIVQMFSHAVDLDPQYRPLATWQSFAQRYQNHLNLGEPLDPGKKSYKVWHPGFSWAIRRKTFEDLGGLIDFCVVGSGDYHMAMSMVNIKTSAEAELKGYNKKLHDWHARCQKAIKCDLGVVSGLITHDWHGKKRDRRYADRRKILINSKFDPSLDLKYESNGLIALTERNPKLVNGLRSYFRARNEDSIDMD